MTTHEFVPRLREAFGDALRCVALYGSAATAEAPPDRTGADVLVIVDALPIEALARAARVVSDWVASGQPAPLTLTTAEWRSSADVFAMEYADVIDRHRVLHGTLPFDGIEVRTEDLRRELEEQVLGKLLKLRRGIMEAGGDATKEQALLEMSFGTFQALMRSVLRLHGERPASDQTTMVQRAATLAGLDAAPFVRVVRHVRGEQTLQPGELRSVLAGYLSGLERLVAHLDQYEPTA